MDESRFDVWTRRRFGLVSGSGIAALALDRFAATEAKKKRKRKRQKKRRCLKVQASCTPGGKRKCCNSLICDEVIDLDGTFCCQPENADCVDDEDCCFPSACFEGFCKLA